MLFRFCDVGYPPVVEEFFNVVSSQGNLFSGLCNLPNPFTGLEEKYSKTLNVTTSSRFQKFGMKPFFLSNVGSLLISLLAFLAAVLLLNILKRIFKNTCFEKKVLKNILQTLQWNTIVGSIIGAQINITLSWCMQLSNPFRNTYDIANFVITIICTIALVVFYILLCFKISWNWKIVREKLFLSRSTLEKAQLIQKQFGVLWEPYNVKATIGRYFVVFQTLRNTVFVVLIAVLANYPIAQCSILIFLSLQFIGAIIVGRPLNGNIDFLTCLANEIIILAQEVILVVFALNKSHNFLTLAMGNRLGWAFIGTTFGAVGFNFIGIVIAIVVMIIQAIKKRKERKARARRRAERISRRSSRHIEESSRHIEESSRHDHNRHNYSSCAEQIQIKIEPNDFTHTSHTRTYYNHSIYNPISLDQSRENPINLKNEQNKGDIRPLKKARKEHRSNDQCQVQDQNKTKDSGHNKDFKVKYFKFTLSKINLL